jgi:hypothetical protein
MQKPERSAVPAHRSQRADHPVRHTTTATQPIETGAHSGGSARGYQAILVPLAAVSTPGYGPTDGQPAEYFSLSHNAKCVSYREMERSASLLHPGFALVMEVRSSSPTLPTVSNLAI